MQGSVANSSSLSDTWKTYSEYFALPHQGTIALQHDKFDVTSQLVPYTLKWIAKSGYEVVNFSVCTDIKNVYDDSLLVKASFLLPAQEVNTSESSPSTSPVNSSRGISESVKAWVLTICLFWVWGYHVI
jgi:hypothetical protein